MVCWGRIALVLGRMELVICGRMAYIKKYARVNDRECFDDLTSVPRGSGMPKSSAIVVICWNKMAQFLSFLYCFHNIFLYSYNSQLNPYTDIVASFLPNAPPPPPPPPPPYPYIIISCPYAPDSGSMAVTIDTSNYVDLIYRISEHLLICRAIPWLA